MKTRVSCKPIPSIEGAVLKVVYVAGYGRSGSTVLDMLLGSHDGVIGMSELTHVFHYWDTGKGCSCGDDFQGCEFWRAVFEKLEFAPGESPLSMTRITKKLESRPLIWSKIFHRSKLKQYKKHWSAVFAAIEEVADRPVIVDSSKTSRLTTFRAKLLAKVCRLPVSTVHLVRDPRAVMWSYLKGNNLELEKGKNIAKKGGAYRVLCSWICTNAAVHLTHWFSPQPYMLLRYEDLIVDPATQMRRICDELQLPVVPKLDYESLQDLPASHGVAGNRVRRKGVQRLVLDDQWKTSLKKSLARLAIVCWPFMKKYKY